jgi:hypothetical protein
MRELLGKFTGLFLKDEKFAQNLDSYIRFLGTKDGIFFRTMMQTMMTMMVEDMLSKQFTALDPTEKDVNQRTYHNLYEILLFLSAPSRWIADKTKVKMSIPNLADRQVGKSKERGI